MIQLSVLDRMNEQLNAITTTQEPSKIDELRGAIGTEFSDNRSPTYRSELLSVSACGNICTVKSVAAYGKAGNVISKQPSYLTWNAIFY